MAKTKVEVARDFSRVQSLEPTVRLVTIQLIFDQDSHSRDEARHDVDQVLQTLQCFGGADVVESCLIKDSFDEAYGILRNKVVEV